jgi:hypothetical protein
MIQLSFIPSALAHHSPEDTEAVVQQYDVAAIATSSTDVTAYIVLILIIVSAVLLYKKFH